MKGLSARDMNSSWKYKWPSNSRLCACGVFLELDCRWSSAWNRRRTQKTSCSTYLGSDKSKRGCTSQELCASKKFHKTASINIRARGNIYIRHRAACTLSSTEPYIYIYFQATPGPRKLHLVILSGRDPDFHRAAISCTGNQYGVRCVYSTQTPADIITLISACLQTEYQHRFCTKFPSLSETQVKHYYTRS